MQIPILNGVYTAKNSDYRTSYPINMIPVPKEHGVSNSYLRPGYGLATYGDGPGTCRGSINWDGTVYMVMGTKLIKVLSSGAFVEIGEVGGTNVVTFDYSFTHLAIASNENLFLWDKTTFQQVTDTDLGTCLDVIWIDGYFMSTDGEYVAVSDIGDPTSWNALKYDSAEADPDPIKAIIKIRNEAYVLNRHTIEVMDNIGGSVFPFARIESAQIEKGTIGTHSCIDFMDKLAFLGSDRNESPAIYLGYNSQTEKISTREIDQVIASYTTAELETVYLEEKIDSGHAHLMCHFPKETWVYDGRVSQGSERIWFRLRSTLEPTESSSSTYQARYHVRCYDKWLFGDPTSNKYGYLDTDTSEHFGIPVRWEFGTTIGYNEGRRAIFHEMELIALPGRSILGDNSTIWTDYSTDGRKWSMPDPVKAGEIGDTEKRLIWLQLGYMEKVRIQRFYGTSDANLSVSRLEAEIEGLN